MKNKFVLMIAALITLNVCFSFVLATECNRSGDTMLITYSPNDLNVGEVFSLTYYDLFGGANQQATLNYPAGLIRLSASDTVTLTDDGFGGGYYTWTMNSTTPGNHTVYVNISYEGSCNVTRVIVIQPVIDQPNIEMSYNITGNVIAKQSKQAWLIINNTGPGTAYNVSGWTSLGSIIDTFSYLTIDAGNSEKRSFNIDTSVCGISSLESTVNYKDEIGYSYPPSHISKTISVFGSDLKITNLELSKNKVKKGQTINIKITIENVNKASSIKAENVVVKLYLDDDKIKTVKFDDLEVGESATKEISWKVSGKTGNAKLRAIVDSGNECSNWNNNEKTTEIKIRKEAEQEEEFPLEEDEEEEKEISPTPKAPVSAAEKPKELDFRLSTAIALEIIVLVLALVYTLRIKKRRIKPLKK